MRPVLSQKYEKRAEGGSAHFASITVGGPKAGEKKTTISFNVPSRLPPKLTTPCSLPEIIIRNAGTKWVSGRSANATPPEYVRPVLADGRRMRFLSIAPVCFMY